MRAIRLKKVGEFDYKTVLLGLPRNAPAIRRELEDIPLMTLGARPRRLKPSSLLKMKG